MNKHLDSYPEGMTNPLGKLCVVVVIPMASDVMFTSVWALTVDDVVKLLTACEVVFWAYAVVKLAWKAAIVAVTGSHVLLVEFPKINGTVSKSNRALPQVFIPRLRTSTANTFITSPAKAWRLTEGQNWTMWLFKMNRLSVYDYYKI